MGSQTVPDDLPRSPTGRIPKWVVAEANGRQVETPGFRAFGVPDPLVGVGEPRRKKRHWVTAVVVVTAIVSVAFVLSQQFGMRPISATLAPQPANAPPAGIEEAAASLAAPPLLDASSTSYRYSMTQQDGLAPVTWSPCRPIHVVIRPDNQPRGGVASIERAIAAVSAATGLVFVNDGATDEVPSNRREAYQPDRYGDRWAPVLVAWASDDEVPDFGVDIAGEAANLRVTSPSGDDAYVSGWVYLDPDAYRQIVATAGRATADAVIMHELAHLVGLDHVNDEAQLMWPRASSATTTYQAGDLTGLAALGNGACQPDL